MPNSRVGISLSARLSLKLKNDLQPLVFDPDYCRDFFCNGVMFSFIHPALLIPKEFSGT